MDKNFKIAVVGGGLTGTLMIKLLLKEKIVEKLISLLINIDKKKFFSNISKKDKNKIFKYLENELFNLGEIKELLSSIKYAFLFLFEEQTEVGLPFMNRTATPSSIAIPEGIFLFLILNSNS